MGTSFGGTVVALGSDPSHLKVGDEVFGFVMDGNIREASVQTYATVPTWREILGYVEGLKRGEGRPRVPYLVDCIGSKEGSLRPLTKIAEAGSKVAVMLPVINVHSSDDQEPEYEMDVGKVFPEAWKKGVDVRGTRTHFYAKNEFFKNHLQPEIVPALLEQGVIKPNKQRIVEGKTLLERAQKALDLLRDQAPSGEKLVWRVADEE
ncbi:hypothetical protein N0V88_004363 [Collariella sp. IMI 366227]|nr:hypothetical protein N0V88_004363 [Collariella sp. IMI 366227]